MATSIKGLLSIYCFIRLTLITSSQCTSIDSDTCYINRSTKWTVSDSDIECDNQLPNCIITCSTSDSSCSPGTTGFPVHINCPLDATSCIINCQSAKSCEGATILATTSKYTEINIGSTDSGKSMTIYSPGYNGGKLHVNLLNSESDFYASTIKSQRNSSLININCQNGNKCTDNTIEGMRVEGYNSSISLLCNGLNSADCSNSNIYCSHNEIITTQKAICNINCKNTQSKTCNNLNIYTNNGIFDSLNINCANHANSCSGTQLYCGPNQNDKYSNLIWDNPLSKWTYEIGGECGFVTENPTPEPTFSPIQLINNNNSASDILSFIALDPLYYIIFILTLSLCCVICILMFWMYHQNKFTKELGFNDDIINKINDDEQFEMTSNGSIILPKSSPGIIRNNINMFTRIPTTSKKSYTKTTEPNTPIPNLNGIHITNGLVNGEYKMSDNEIDIDMTEDDSLILESSPMYNPNYNNQNRNIFNNKSHTGHSKSDKSNKTKSNKSKSPHTPISNSNNNISNINIPPKQMVNNNSDTINSHISISMMNTPSNDTMNTPTDKQIQLKTIHQNQSSESLQNINLHKALTVNPSLNINTMNTKTKSIQSPMSMLSGVPTLVESRVSNLSRAKTAPVHKNNIISNESSESTSESASSSGSDSVRENKRKVSKDGISNRHNNILDTLSRKKSKFALPAAYNNMSPQTVKKILKKNEDAIVEYTKQISLDPNHPHHNIHKQMELQQKQIKRNKQPRPHMPIMPVPITQHQFYNIQHAVPYNINNNLHVPPKNHKYNHKNKSNKSNTKHRKNTNKSVATAASVATSVVSELTELTELTEQTEQTGISKSQSQSHSSEYSESDTNDSDSMDTDYTEATTNTTKIYNRNVCNNSNSSNGSNSCGSTGTGTDSESNSSMSATDYNDVKDDIDEYTYNDTEDNYTYRSSNREQSKTLNEKSRITYNERSAKEMTIKSDVLDADIMDVLYDNKIKPLLESKHDSEHIDNEMSNSSSAPSPSPHSVSYDDNDEEEEESSSDSDYENSNDINENIFEIIGGNENENENEEYQD